MKRRFISIRSKFLLLLGYFLVGLIAVIFVDAWFDNAHERMDLRYQGLLQQNEYAYRIQHLVEATHSDLYRLVYQGDAEAQSRILVNNEDLLAGFEVFSTTSQEYGFHEDAFIVPENETILQKLRADIFRLDALLQSGEQDQAVHLLVHDIEPGV